MKRIALVTGATSGVGREFVRQLDGRYYGKIDEFWAVGRNAAALKNLQESMYAPVRPFALDLRSPDSLATLEQELEAVRGQAELTWLVNSAGVGRFENLLQMSADDLLSMICLNCLATATLCSIGLKLMNPGAHIINMASVAAYLPLPDMGAYAATKSFVLDMTRSLNEDLRGTGITACAVCPKAMKTAFWDNAGPAQDMGFFLGTERPYDVVRRALIAAERGRGSVITAPDMKVVCALAKIMPYDVLAALWRGAKALRSAQEFQNA